MKYIILDLEWNNSYNKQLQKLFNEIIELGAVMVDEKMEMVSTFSVLVRARLVKKLSGRTKSITHISNEDMYGGVSLEKAISDFTKWIGDDDDCVFMSWGVEDLHVMHSNLQYFIGLDTIPFMKRYANLQSYCQSVLKRNSGQQLGLASAAALLGIDISEYSTHRALDDSLISWRCLCRVYKESALLPFVQECNEDFYHRLLFKAHNITDINDPKINRNDMVCICPDCKIPMKKISRWRVINQSFRAKFQCSGCGKRVLFSVRFRENFDGVVVRPVIVSTEKPKTETSEDRVINSNEKEEV